jgi:hypothetical protein
MKLGLNFEAMAKSLLHRSGWGGGGKTKNVAQPILTIGFYKKKETPKFLKEALQIILQ